MCFPGPRSPPAPPLCPSGHLLWLAWDGHRKRGNFFLPVTHVLWCGFALARAMIQTGLFSSAGLFWGFFGAPIGRHGSHAVSPWAGPALVGCLGHPTQGLPGLGPTAHSPPPPHSPHAQSPFWTAPILLSSPKSSAGEPEAAVCSVRQDSPCTEHLIPPPSCHWAGILSAGFPRSGSHLPEPPTPPQNPEHRSISANGLCEAPLLSLWGGQEALTHHSHTMGWEKQTPQHPNKWL